jgi:Secretion system C-terminal sorting domain
MKTKLFTLLFANVMMIASITAQSNFYGNTFKHTATSANTSGHITDIPATTLANVANKTLLVQHNYGNYNTSEVGVYNNGSGYSIFNQQTINNIPVIDSYFVLDPNQNGVALKHTINATGLSFATEIDHPLLNGKPDAKIFITKNWDPNSIYDTTHTGVWYNGSKWTIYNELPGSNLTASATYNVFIPNPSTNLFTHISTEGSYLTTIDNTLTNNKPDLMLFATHNYTNSASHYVNATTSVWYDGSKWTIYTDNFTPLPIGTQFNVLIANRAAAATAIGVEITGTKWQLLPNPCSAAFTIISSGNTLLQSAEIVDAFGKTVLQKKFIPNEKYLVPTTSLIPGMYIVRITNINGVITKPLQIQ